MSIRLQSLTSTALCAVALAWLAALPAAAQKTPDIPRLADGKPDFNGIWDRPRVNDMTKNVNTCGSGAAGCKQEGEANLPYAAWGLAKWKEPEHFDYTARCLPWGYTRAMGTEYPVEIMQTPRRLAVLFESNDVFHVIPTDGRKHPESPDPSWWGNSVGRYEGDTLIIDTVGFNEMTYLDTAEHPHSDQLHLVERYKHIDANHLSYEVTIEDKKAYERPWKNTRIFSRMKPGSELMEYVCMENNKDLFEGRISLKVKP